MEINSTLVGAALCVAVIISALLFMCKFHKTSVGMAVASFLTVVAIIIPRVGIFFNLPAVMRFEGEHSGDDREMVVWNVLRLTHEEVNIWFGGLTLVAVFAMGISVLIILRFLALPKRSKTSTHFQPLKKKTEVIHASDWLPRVK